MLLINHAVGFITYYKWNGMHKISLATGGPLEKSSLLGSIDS